jgi:TolA-binding protein
VTHSDDRSETAARCQFQIGECLFLLGRHDEALQELVKVTVAYSYPAWSSKALFEMGRVLEDKGEKDRAVAQYKEVVEQYPESDAAAAARERLKKLGV